MLEIVVVLQDTPINTKEIYDIHIVAQECLDCGYRFWKEEPIIFNHLLSDACQVDKIVAEQRINNGLNQDL